MPGKETKLMPYYPKWEVFNYLAVATSISVLKVRGLVHGDTFKWMLALVSQ